MFRKLPIILLLVISLSFIGIVHADYTIENGYVWFENANARINCTATSAGLINQEQVCDFTYKAASPLTINSSVVFNLADGVKPTKAYLWQNISHTVYEPVLTSVNHSLTVEGVSSFSTTTDECEWGEGAIKRNVTFHPTLNDDGNTTIKNVSKVFCFDGYTNVGNNYTIWSVYDEYVSTPVQRYWFDWNDITSAFSVSTYNSYKIGTIQAAWTQGQTRTVKFEYQTLPNTEGKFDIYFHQGSAAQAIANPNLIKLKLDPWWDSSWGYKMPCYINTTVSSSLSNFPAYCLIDTAALITAGKMNSTCKDLRVLNSSEDGELDYETEGCNSTATVVWHRLQSTTADGNDTVYIYYGNNDAADAQNPTGVWSNGFMYVWHGGTLIDSVSGRGLSILGTVGNITDTTGAYCKLGSCWNITNGALYNATMPIVLGSNATTMSLWARLTPSQPDYMFWQGVWAAHGAKGIRWGGVGANKLSGGPLNYESWILSNDSNMSALNYYAYSFNPTGNNNTVYLNTTQASAADTPITTGTGITIAGGTDAYPTTVPSTGYFDEVRLSNVTRSTDWLKAEYAMTSSMGAEETSGNNAPNASITYPTNNSVFCASSALNITWQNASTTNQIAFYNLSLLNSDYSFNGSIMPINTTPDLFYNWNGTIGGTAIPPGSYVLELNATDTADLNSSSYITFNYTFCADFTSPTPPNSTNNFTYGMIYNFTSTSDLTNCLMEIDGTNYTGTIHNNDKSCSYTLSYTEHIFNNTYDVIGFGNVSGTMYQTNETRTIPYYGCGYVNGNGTMLGNISILGNTCFTINTNNILLDGNGYELTGDNTVDSYGVYQTFKSNNILKNLSIKKFYMGIFINSGSYNNITNNIIYEYGITDYGIHLYNGSNSNNLIDNIVYNSTFPIYLSSSHSNIIIGNVADGSLNSGFTISSSWFNILTNNSAYNHDTNGFFIGAGGSNTLNNNTAFNNNLAGFRISGSSTNTLTGNIAYHNSHGINLYSSTNTNLINTHIYNNTIGLYFTTGALTSSAYITNLSIDNPSGDYQNYTILDISDTLEANSGYKIDWTQNSSALPNNYFSFANKYINISTVSGTPSIDSITFHWQDSELNETTPSGTEYCYQETANASSGVDGSCGLNFLSGEAYYIYDGGRGYITDPELTWDGDWDTKTTSYLGRPPFETGSFYVNYTKATGAINATWQTKYNQEYATLDIIDNITLSTECFNQNPIQLQFYTEADVYQMCWNGTAWETIGTYGNFDGSPIRLYEDGIYWEVPAYVTSEIYDEDSFHLYKYNGTWTRLNNTPDTTNNQISLFNLASFSEFAILEQNASAGFIAPTPENGSIVTDNPIELIWEATATISDPCYFDINGLNYTGTNNGTACNLSFTNLTHNNQYNITGWANLSGMFIQVNETRTITWNDDSNCIQFIDAFAINGTAPYVGVGGAYLYVNSTITLNNTCASPIASFQYDINDSVADATWITYFVDLNPNELKNFTGYQFRIPITFTNNGAITPESIFAKSTNNLYTLTTTYPRNMTGIYIQIAALSDDTSLYKCELDTCTYLPGVWEGILSYTIDSGYMQRSGDNLNTTIRYVQSYNVISAGGGGTSGSGSSGGTFNEPPTAVAGQITEVLPEGTVINIFDSKFCCIPILIVIVLAGITHLRREKR